MIKPACLISSKYYEGFFGFFFQLILLGGGIRHCFLRAETRLLEQQSERTEKASALEGNMPEPEPNSAPADRFCILEKSPKKADVYEKLSAQENVERSGDPQSSFLVMR